MAIATTRRAVTTLRPGVAPRQRPDDLAVEAPLSLVLDETVIATVMRTPGHDVELAAGWLVVESGVQRRADVDGLAEVHGFDIEPDRVVVRLAAGVAPPRPRAWVTSAACGVCSTDVLDLEGTRPEGAPAASPDWTVEEAVLAALPDAMREHQRAFDRTGGLHGAAVATAAGELLVVREDVGRHNAVDKVVGRSLLEGPFPLTDHLLVLSGRVSFELVQKAVAAGLSGLVAVSAPSSLAVDLAREHGLVLAGMVRGGRMNLYAGAERVRPSPVPPA